MAEWQTEAQISSNERTEYYRQVGYHVRVPAVYQLPLVPDTADPWRLGATRIVIRNHG